MVQPKKDESKKITVWNFKGGEGKTTIACAIALEGDWAIITNDLHSDLTSALDESRYLVLDPGQPLPTKEDLEGANIIFDPGGFLDTRMIDAIKMSDYVIIPISEPGRKLNSERFMASILEIEQYNKNSYTSFVAEISEQRVVDSAVKQMKCGTLVKIISAQTQVVAGTNYLLELEIETKDASHHTYKAVVFVPLPVAQLPMQLTKFQDMGVTKNNN